MTHASVSVCAVLAAALLAGPFEAEGASSGRKPRSAIQCLAPSSMTAMPCATVPAGSTLLVAAKPQKASLPLTLFFREVSQSYKPKVTRVTVPPQARLADGTYRVTIPSSLCAGRQGRNQYEVQQLWRDFNLLESLGMIDVGC